MYAESAGQIAKFRLRPKPNLKLLTGNILTGIISLFASLRNVEGGLDTVKFFWFANVESLLASRLLSS